MEIKLEKVSSSVGTSASQRSLPSVSWGDPGHQGTAGIARRFGTNS